MRGRRAKQRGPELVEAQLRAGYARHAWRAQAVEQSKSRDECRMSERVES